MEGVNPPYILLGNHNSFSDFKVVTKAIFPHGANYVISVDGFINREKLLRNVGGICKRKFINDIFLVKNINYSLKQNKTILIMYPEARYSHVGTTAILPESLGKMIKLMKFPVVTLLCHGNHLRQPIWNLRKRKVKATADMTQILKKEDLEKLSVSEINHIIEKSFIYDDYKYQKENKIAIKEDFRAEGLHKVLYQCPVCKKEGEMDSKGNKIWCKKCGKAYEMSVYGELTALSGKTEFSHIPDWYEWQRQNVKEEIMRGEYSLEIPVNIDSLPNSKGFYRLGEGVLKHDEKGFLLTAKFGDVDFSLHKPVLENYSVHIEYDYFGKGDAVSLSTQNDTFYLFPINIKNIITKIHFAVEELFKQAKVKRLK
jgi:ribosomal protein L37AE/L43A